MKFPCCPPRPGLLLALALLGLAAPACRKARPPERVDIAELKTEIAPELQTNQLGGLSGPMYEAYAASPIHWQVWHPKLFQQSKDSKRLILCAIARPSSPGCHALLRELEGNPQVVADINSHYIPVLVDADLAAEFILFGAELSAEINRKLAFPVLIWLNSDRHALAATPVSQGQPGGIAQVFNQSHAMISSMWKDDLEQWMANGKAGYIERNSAFDHNKRVERLKAQYAGRRMSAQAAELVPQAIRRLGFQYDTAVENFGTAGSMVPAQALCLLAEASRSESLDPSIRKEARQVASSLSASFMASPMIDPLEGGVFSYRTGQSWKLPIFIKDCVTQAEMAQGLMAVHRATGDPRALAVAEDILAYAESHHAAADGLFALGANEDAQPVKWTWTLEEIQAVLEPAEAEWWIAATGMVPLGNVPVEMDSGRALLRKNALALRLSPADTARSLSMAPDEFQRRFDAARQKLARIRETRLQAKHVDRSAHLESSLKMVMAYVQAYQVTKDEKWKGKALGLMKRCRETFVIQGKLLPCGHAGEASLTAARARHHALEALASLQLDRIESSPENRNRVQAALEALAGHHLSDGVLCECPVEARKIDLSIEDDRMLTGVSSVGMLCQVAAGCGRMGVAMPESLRPLVEVIPVDCVVDPLVYSDRLLGALDQIQQAPAAPH